MDPRIGMALGGGMIGLAVAISVTFLPLSFVTNPDPSALPMCILVSALGFWIGVAFGWNS